MLYDFVFVSSLSQFCRGGVFIQIVPTVSSVSNSSENAPIFCTEHGIYVPYILEDGIYAKQLKDSYSSKLLDLWKLIMFDRADSYDVQYCQSASSSRLTK